MGKSNAQTCPKTFGGELITNGNFSAGNTGFTSDYTYGSPTIGIGQYSVGTNPNTMEPGYYVNMGDHTSGTGNMLVVDVDGVLGKKAYTTTVTVVANTTYFFSAWFADVSQTFHNPPKLKFSINGMQVGDTVYVDPNANSNGWSQFFISWNSGAASGPTSIDIQNVLSQNQGNDLALDDISFSTSCANISNLATLGKTANLPDTVYNCNVSFPYTMNPSLGAGYGFQWKLAGVTQGTSSTYSVSTQPASGTKYYLCYDTIVGCPRTDSVIFITAPLSVNLGPNVVMCTPVNYTINSGNATPPAVIQWSLGGTPIVGANASTYTATAPGTYSVNVSRAGCGSATGSIVISTPTSTIAGSGTYCTSTNTASFSVTGSTLVKWYVNNVTTTALNPGNSNPTISLAETATNTTTPGCISGLYAQDMSTYPGTLYPSAPCAASTSNTSGTEALMINVTQSLSLTSVSFYQNAGWGASGTFTFSIYNNNTTGGPYCGSCTPNGTYDGVGSTQIYTQTTPSYTVGASNTVRTLTLTTPQTLAPGQYWLTIVASGTALGAFNCTPASGVHQQWTTPAVDNTGNNVLSAIKGLDGGNYGNSGGLFNIQFQVGSSNACSRLFVCATSSCAAPIQLLNFTATKSYTGALLNWSTATEKNNSYFVIERSTDGSNFVAVGQVQGAGNSSSIKSYSYFDNFTISGTVYYRLVQYDYNGESSYSEVKALSSGSVEIVVFPNPFEDHVKLIVNTASKEKISIKVFSVIGVEVFSSDSYYSNEYIILGGNLAKGVYIIQVAYGDESKNIRVIKSL